MRTRYQIPVYLSGSAMSELGQNAKYSERADVFRFAPDTRHCVMQSALRICAKSGSQSAIVFKPGI